MTEQKQTNNSKQFLVFQSYLLRRCFDGALLGSLEVTKKHTLEGTNVTYTTLGTLETGKSSSQKWWLGWHK